jgi:nitronate monooxygenase
MRIRDRTSEFCNRFGLRVPILLAPMAGASTPALSIAVTNAGGLGACGALLMARSEIVSWANEVQTASNGRFQVNLWIPDRSPIRNAAQETRVREFLANWGPVVAEDAGDARSPDFAEQCEALLETSPPIVSSVMGLYPSEFVDRLKSLGIAWFANTSTVAESKAAESAGADVVVVQGMEAGGHRGCFDSSKAEREMVGLASLIPAVVDAVGIPVVATGGIADGRGVAAALALGASAVQVGTGFLRAPEAVIHPAWAGGPKSGNRLRARRHLRQCAATCTLSGSARSHRRHESRRGQSGRRESHAGVGRTVCRPRARGAGPTNRRTSLEERPCDSQLLRRRGMIWNG